MAASDQPLLFASPSPIRLARWARILTAGLISVSLHLLTILVFYAAAQIMMSSHEQEMPSYAGSQMFTAQLASQNAQSNALSAAIKENLTPKIEVGEAPDMAKGMQSFLGQSASPAAATSISAQPVKSDIAARPNLGSALLTAPNYHASIGLDPPPKPLQDIQPEYPKEGNLQVGSVVLRLLINEQGLLDEVAVVRSSPAGIFENAAVAAFSAAKFSPGKLLGLPVKSQMTIEVEFTPINRGAAVSGRGY